MKKKFYQVNQQIQAKSLRVIDSRGKQIGILPVNKALQLAKDEDLDLVEIAPKAAPPVAKLIDFKRFKFEQELKEKKAAKKVKAIETKEIRVRPFISDHDLQTRMNQARKFLKSGDNFKLTVHFTPRQMRHTEFAAKIFDKVKEFLADLAQVVREPKWEGRRFTVIFSKSPHAKG